MRIYGMVCFVNDEMKVSMDQCQSYPVYCSHLVDHEMQAREIRSGSTSHVFTYDFFFPVDKELS